MKTSNIKDVNVKETWFNKFITIPIIPEII